MRHVIAILVVAGAAMSACDRAAVPAPSSVNVSPAVPPAPADTPASHPLDPLTANEIRAAIAAAGTDSRLAGALYPSVALHEPPKGEVLAWQPGSPLARHARLLAMTETQTYEVVVDVTAKRVSAVTERPGAEPPLTLSEIEATKFVLSHPEFQAGLQRRGLTDTSKIFCGPFSAGFYGDMTHIGKRLVKVGCFDTRRSTTNLFAWPIERLYALVDLRKRQVLSVRDEGVVPISENDLNYTAAAIGAVREVRKPTALTQPEGSNVHIDGHRVTWGNWQFHVRIDPRVGTSISMARWRDNGSWRSVLYQGYLSEMFVPYMDSDYGWQSRTYFDSGEYGAGILASPLKAGVDCPATATFLPSVFSTDKGEPFTTPDALCVFERAAGDPVWRHYEVLNQTYEGRPNVELVVRMASTIGNYDYLFDWVFNDAAEIEARVGATGIDALKGVITRRMSDPTARADTRYGTLVAPNLVAVNHDHYFNFRLDLDVDGPGNTFSHEVYTPVTLPKDSPRRSIYVVEPRVPATETGARLDRSHSPSKLRVVNESRTNAVGNAVSYEVLVANHARLLLDPADWPARRARFLQHDVWVTPYSPTERYAAGEYALGSRGDDGLAVWAARDRAIRNQDIVMWVNLGMHHLTRAEDVPVMPMVWHSFKLRPHNFFNRNPAIDLRAEPVDQ